MTVFALATGLLVGSFLYRLAAALLTGRFDKYLRCPYCGTEYSKPLALEAIPHKLRCPSCGAPYLARPLATEFITATLFALALDRFGVNLYLPFALLYICAYILAMLADLEARIIPNKLIYPAMALAIIGEAIPSIRNLKAHILAGVVAFALFAFFYLMGVIYIRLKGKSPEEVVAFGAGDVKLATFIGITLGLPEGLQALMVGILLNGLVVLVLLAQDLLRRKPNLMRTFPYGPALIVSALAFLIT